MRTIELSSENEMVLTFLRGEADSPSWQGSNIQRCLAELGRTKDLIENAMLDDPGQNQDRIECLGRCRGYAHYLFQGFPNKVHWQRVILSIDELGRAKYLNQAGGWIRGQSTGLRSWAACVGRWRPLLAARPTCLPRARQRGRGEHPRHAQLAQHRAGLYGGVQGGRPGG